MLINVSNVVLGDLGRFALSTIYLYEKMHHILGKISVHV